MQFILAIMFFVAPPTAGKDRPWALQSTQSIEFADWGACDDTIRNVILPAVKSTDTIALTAWCLPKAASGDARVKFFSEQKESAKPLTTEAAKAQMPKLGSCYDYVPPPVSARKPSDQRDVTVGLLGQCRQK